jgi:exodeoxyribonuclease III
MALRILSYNILAGGEDRLPLISSVIQQQQPDVVALMEARNLSNVETLAQQLGMNLTIGESNNVNQDHVVWLSRLPVLRANNHRHPVFAKTLLEIEILWEGTALALFATHLKAGQDYEREQHRVAEMQAIVGIMQRHDDRPHILVGDLNTLHPTDQPDVSAAIATLKKWGEDKPVPQFPRQVIPMLLNAGYVDCYRTLHPGIPGYTSHTAHPALRIDYIFAVPSFAQRLQACDIVTGSEAISASDHFPVWAEFK